MNRAHRPTFAPNGLTRRAVLVAFAFDLLNSAFPRSAHGADQPRKPHILRQEVIRLVGEPQNGRVYDLAFAPARSSALCVFALDRSVQVWDLREKSHMVATLTTALPELDDDPTSHPISFSRDGSRLAMGYSGIQIWDFDQKRLLFAVPLQWNAEAIQFTATESDLIVACSYHGSFKIVGGVPGKIQVIARAEYERMRVSDPRNFNVYGGPSIRRLAGTDPPEMADFYCLAVYPDGKRFVAGGVSVPPGQPRDRGAEPLVKVWETATGRRTLVIGDKEEPIARFCLSPDGRTLYSCGSTVLGWDATKSGPPVKKFDAPIRQGISIAVSPAEQCLR